MSLRSWREELPHGVKPSEPHKVAFSQHLFERNASYLTLKLKPFTIDLLSQLSLLKPLRTPLPGGVNHGGQGAIRELQRVRLA